MVVPAGASKAATALPLSCGVNQIQLMGRYDAEPIGPRVAASHGHPVLASGANRRGGLASHAPRRRQAADPAPSAVGAPWRARGRERSGWCCRRFRVGSSGIPLEAAYAAFRAGPHSSCAASIAAARLPAEVDPLTLAPSGADSGAPGAPSGSPGRRSSHGSCSDTGVRRQSIRGP